MLVMIVTVRTLILGVLCKLRTGLDDAESDLEISSSDSHSDLDHEAPSSDEETDVLPVVNSWSYTTSPVVVEAFVEEIGSFHVLDESAEPYDYFSLIVDEQLYQVAAEQTNLLLYMPLNVMKELVKLMIPEHA